MAPLFYSKLVVQQVLTGVFLIRFLIPDRRLSFPFLLTGFTNDAHSKQPSRSCQAPFRVHFHTDSERSTERRSTHELGVLLLQPLALLLRYAAQYVERVTQARARHVEAEDD